jgi:Protein of unknown function (DUF1441)
MPSPARINIDDKETTIIFSGGATMSELARMMSMDRRDVLSLLVKNNVRSTGKRDGNPIYPIKEAMRYLARPPDSVLERVIQGNLKSLPPALMKDYWFGKRASLAYGREVGNLWTTEKVMEYCGEAFQAIRMAVMLLPDQLQRELALPATQMGRLEEIIDEVMKDAKRKLVDAFGDRAKAPNNAGRADSEPEDEGDDGEV